MKPQRMTKLACLTLVLLPALQTPALAEAVKLAAQLTGADEIPPVTSTASGMFEGFYDTKSKKLGWTISYSGLSGPITRVDLHGPAEFGSHGSIKLRIPSAASPIKGATILIKPSRMGFDEELKKGLFYVNVHTKAHPNGEIRGQIKKQQ